MSEVFSDKPVKIVEIPLMTAGLCGYGDRGNIYISDATMYVIMPKLLGMPVILTHEGTESIGEVVDVFQNTSDTDQWMGKLAIRSTDVVDKLASGWGVSTAYKILRETSQGGKWNNIEYDSEVLDVEWLHVAVVDNPRYTIAKDGVFLNSVKGEPMFNLFKIKREKVLLNEDEKLFVKVGDEELELSDIIKKVSEEELKNKKNFASDDMEVEINGEKICVKELIDRYNACKKNEEEKVEEKKEEVKEEVKNEDKEEDKKDEDKKENEEEKVEEKKEEVKEEEKKNEEEKKEEIKKEEEKKEEVKNSLEVKQAYLDRGMNIDLEYKTMSERIALANKKYGSVK